MILLKESNASCRTLISLPSVFSRAFLNSSCSKFLCTLTLAISNVCAYIPAAASGDVTCAYTAPCLIAAASHRATVTTAFRFAASIFVAVDTRRIALSRHACAAAIEFAAIRTRLYARPLPSASRSARCGKPSSAEFRLDLLVQHVGVRYGCCPRLDQYWIRRRFDEQARHRIISDRPRFARQIAIAIAFAIASAIANVIAGTASFGKAHLRHSRTGDLLQQTRAP
ncbi:hypothetical protein AYI70_g7105 [Smittium culicis]|uniref:Uncharacterized protein n=1 Tax=Smittium culicis TaxID=133412 RepID=A0A1R1XM09_9FUNG|nr:hypothetical protein AYI70_g7105 [Smittium culicis]